MSKLVRDLIAARDFILQGFCKHAAAQDEAGNAIVFDHPDAKSFCSVGACWRTRRDIARLEFYSIRDMTNALHANLPKEYKTVSSFDDGVRPGHTAHIRHSDVVKYNNDPNTTQADVVAMFDGAIKTAKGMPDDIK